MPPGTGSLTWTRHLRPIPGVSYPVWTKLNPVEHLDAVYASAINYGWQDLHPHPVPTPEQKEARDEVVRQRLHAEVARGEQTVEVTTIPAMAVDGVPSTPGMMELYRVTDVTPDNSTVSGRPGRLAEQPRWIVLVKSLPTTTRLDLRTLNSTANSNIYSSMDVIVHDGRPLFIGMNKDYVAVSEYMVRSSNQPPGETITAMSAAGLGPGADACFFDLHK